MADNLSYFLTLADMSASNTPASQVLRTYGKRDMSIFLAMPVASGGSAADTLDVTIEECPNEDFSPADQVRLVTLTSPTGTTATAMTQIAGGSSTTAAYEQKWNLSDKNYSRFLRARTTITGTASVFADVSIYLAYNERV